MATLGELQQQLADLKERYSAVIGGSYSAVASIATIAENMQAQLEDAQIAASSAGEYAAAAETSANNAATAGAEAGETAGEIAGASAAQAKYDAIFTQENTWQASQTITGDLTVSAAVQAQDLDVANQVKAGECRITHEASEVIITAEAKYSDAAALDISNQDSSAPNVVLACYSAALQSCSVANTLYIGTLQIGEATLSYSELTQLKALINQ